MEKLIIGSTAAKFWFFDFREPKDKDFLTREPAMSREVQHYWFGESSEYILAHNPESIHFASPETLLTLKASHAKWDIHWDKTMSDIHFFQRRGLKINHELYKLLMVDFTRIHGRRWASLKGKDSKTFFEDAVTRKYNHDSIHKAVAYYDSAPLYERILKNDGSVGCSQQKFESLSLEDKLKLVKEEVFVTALERFLIPNNFKYSTQRAYWLSLKKLITTMSANWFSLFIIENYSNLALNRDDYVKTFRANADKLIEN